MSPRRNGNLPSESPKYIPVPAPRIRLRRTTQSHAGTWTLMPTYVCSWPWRMIVLSSTVT